MTVLRVYHPEECDEHGVPLDWERCEICSDGRMVTQTFVNVDGVMRDSGERIDHGPCDRCAGYGSLKAAALGMVVQARLEASPAWSCRARCEDCLHPMSDGTWSDDDGPAGGRNRQEIALCALRDGEEPMIANLFEGVRVVHWSACDERCRHADPIRWRPDAEHSWEYPERHGVLRLELAAARSGRGMEAVLHGESQAEASWRQVDVRTLGWAHDLRPERLAVLCLRCWAARKDHA